MENQAMFSSAVLKQLVFLIGLHLSCCPASQAFDEEPEIPTFEKVVPISGTQFANPIEVNIGDVEAGSKVRLVIGLKSQLPVDFKINKIQVGCSCVIAKSYGDLLRPGEQIALELKIKAPDKSENSKEVQYVRIIETEQSHIQLMLVFELKGLACFGVKSVIQQMEPKSTIFEFEAPLVITAPADPKNIEVQAGGDIKGIELEIKQKENGFVLHGKLPIKDVPIVGIAGEITLNEKKLGRKASIPVFISRNGEISVSPHVTRFVKEEDKWVATAIVAIHESLLGDTKTADQAAPVISIQCKADSDVIVSCEQKQIGTRLFRVNLDLDFPPDHQDDALQGWPTNIQWKVSLNEKVYGTVTSVRKVE
jgi:hypothetical protein